MEGGHKKKGSKDNECTNEGESQNGGDNDTAPTNAKRKKMIRGPMTCKKNTVKKVTGKLVPSAHSMG
jgi:hypothetical protein